MINRSIKIIAVILALCMVSGCWDLREINESSISTRVGIDLDEGDKIAFSAQLIRPLPPGEAGSGEIETVVATARDYGVALAARRLSLSLSKIPEWSHVRAFILGEKLAGHDLSPVVDFMTRNRHIRPDTNLVVCSKASPAKLLSSVSNQSIDIASGLSDLVKLNQKQLGIYVPITMGEFTYKLMTPGIEPVVPQITLEKAQDKQADKNSGDKKNQIANNKDNVILSGMAVFKGNKMAGSFNEYESRGYRWLSSTSKEGGLFNAPAPGNPEKYITLETAQFSSKTRPQFSGDDLKMLIEIRADLGFYQQDYDADILSLERKSELEAIAAREIKNQISACINRSQKLGSDVLGWGITIQEYEPDKWKEVTADWPEQFPYTASEIKVQVNIKRSMLTNKSFRFN